MLYHLALDPKVQDRLRAELIQAGEDLGYDALMNLPLLDAVCRETMRKRVGEKDKKLRSWLCAPIYQVFVVLWRQLQPTRCFDRGHIVSAKYAVWAAQVSMS